MHRQALTEQQWRRWQAVLPRQEPGPEATRGDRVFIEAVLTLRARTGRPWRDLPDRFGPWNSVSNRFSNWAKKGHWAAIIRAVPIDIDDTGYDSNRFRQAVRDDGMKPVIASKPERPRTLPKSRVHDATRYLVEGFFHELKRFRAIATPLRGDRAEVPRAHAGRLRMAMAGAEVGTPPRAACRFEWSSADTLPARARELGRDRALDAMMGVAHHERAAATQRTSRLRGSDSQAGHPGRAPSWAGSRRSRPRSTAEHEAEPTVPAWRAGMPGGTASWVSAPSSALRARTSTTTSS